MGGSSHCRKFLEALCETTKIANFAAKVLFIFFNGDFEQRGFITLNDTRIYENDLLSCETSGFRRRVVCIMKDGCFCTSA